MTATVWTALVRRPRSVPIEQVHVMLYSFFPAVAPGQPRPYVWRLLAPERIGLISALRPTAPDAVAHRIDAGTTWDFMLTYKRVRNVGGNTTRDDGTRRMRDKRTVTINDMTDLRARLLDFTAKRGGAVGYVRLDAVRDLRLPRAGGEITLPIVDACGKVLITDPEAFAGLLASGGPGTGKAYGCGAWWLPQMMERAA